MVMVSMFSLIQSQAHSKSRLHSTSTIQFNSIQFNSIQINSVQFSSGHSGIQFKLSQFGIAEMATSNSDEASKGQYYINLIQCSSIESFPVEGNNSQPQSKTLMHLVQINFQSLFAPGVFSTRLLLF